MGWICFVFICESEEQILQVNKRDQAVSVAVIVRPLCSEIIEALLFERDVGQVCLTEESVDYDSDEEIEEDLRDYHLKGYMKTYSEVRTAAFRPVWVLRVVSTLYDTVVVLCLVALVQDRIRLVRIKHD